MYVYHIVSSLLHWYFNCVYSPISGYLQLWLSPLIVFCFLYDVLWLRLPSRVLPPRFLFIYLRGFALKVVISIYLRGFALKVVIITCLRGFALKVIVIYLRGFALKVAIIIYLRGFALKVVIITYLRGFALKVVIIIYLRGFALKVVLFTFEVLPSRLCLPSRFRPQGCLIFTLKVSPWRVINLGIFKACWCVDFMSDMACSCPLINIYLFNSF